MNHDGPLCIGHSHVAALQRAARQSGYPLRAVNFWEHAGAVLQEADGVRFAAAIEAQVRAHRGPVYSLLGGSVHNVLGMVSHPQRFDFVLPSHPQLPLDALATYLPSRAVRELMRSHIDGYLAQMRRLRALTSQSVIHLSPPPPSANQRRLAQDIPWSMYPDMPRDVAPASLRLKLWLLQGELWREGCQANAVQWLACPPQACDEDGYLTDACYGDGAHANAYYGQLVLAQWERYQ